VEAKAVNPVSSFVCVHSGSFFFSGYMCVLCVNLRVVSCMSG